MKALTHIPGRLIDELSFELPAEIAEKLDAPERLELEAAVEGALARAMRRGRVAVKRGTVPHGDPRYPTMMALRRVSALAKQVLEVVRENPGLRTHEVGKKLRGDAQRPIDNTVRTTLMRLKRDGQIMQVRRHPNNPHGHGMGWHVPLDAPGGAEQLVGHGADAVARRQRTPREWFMDLTRSERDTLLEIASGELRMNVRRPGHLPFGVYVVGEPYGPEIWQGAPPEKVRSVRPRVVERLWLAKLIAGSLPTNILTDMMVMTATDEAVVIVQESLLNRSRSRQWIQARQKKVGGDNA